MARIHLIEGAVGAGKTTFASQLCRLHAGLHLAVDDWMATLFRPDRPSAGVIEWYIERKERCIEQIWKLSCGLMRAKVDAILELGLIQRHSRECFYDRVAAAGHDMTIYVLDAPRETRRARVMERNRVKGASYAMEVPEQFFELASDMWESPDDVECEGRDMRFIATEH